MVVESEREQWLEERRKGIGGSDAAAVCGMSPWKTPLDVYYEKIGEMSGDEENEDMRRGTLMEPVVRQMYADAVGEAVLQPDCIIHNEQYPWALANLDGEMPHRKRILECKTSRDRRGWGEPWSNEIPMAYLFQVQHYMAVAQYDAAHVAVMFGTDFEFAIYEVEADAEFQGLMMEREAEFWEMVQNRTPPDPTTPADVSKRWPISKPIGRPATKDELEVGGQLLAIKEYFNKLKQYKEVLESELKHAMQEAEAMTCGEETIVTWKTAKAPTRFDEKRFKEDYPELHQQYLYQAAPSRRFLLKENAKCLQIMKPMLRENLLPRRQARD